MLPLALYEIVCYTSLNSRLRDVCIIGILIHEDVNDTHSGYKIITSRISQVECLFS